MEGLNNWIKESLDFSNEKFKKEYEGDWSKDELDDNEVVRNIRSTNRNPLVERLCLGIEYRNDLIEHLRKRIEDLKK
jgi:hypothetical protein